MTRALREVRAARHLGPATGDARRLRLLTVLKAEAGTRRPSPEIVRRLSDTLSVEPSEVTEFRRALCLPTEEE